MPSTASTSGNRPHGDVGISTATGVLGAVLAVAIVLTLLGTDLPERLACRVTTTATTVSGVSGDPTVAKNCEDSSAAQTTATETTVAGGASVGRADLAHADPGRADPGRSGSGRADVAGSTDDAGGLTATSYTATDEVASPAARDRAFGADVAAASRARCAAAPDLGTWESKICPVGPDEDADEAAQGSSVLLRCPVAETAPTTGRCLTTGDDDVRGHRTTLRTGPGDGDVRFCRPLRVQPLSDGSATFGIDWACAGWSDNLYHCRSTVPAADIGSPRRDGFLVAGVGWSIDEDWVERAGFRDLWPRSCGSRTFEPALLACTPDRATNLAACDIRAYQGLPLRPARCVLFHPHAGERGRLSHTLGRPMHCRLVRSPGSDVVTPDDAALGDCRTPGAAPVGGPIRCTLPAGPDPARRLLAGCAETATWVRSPGRVGPSRRPLITDVMTLGRACRTLRPGSVHQAAFIPPGPLSALQEVTVELTPLTANSPGLTAVQAALVQNVADLQAVLQSLPAAHNGVPVPAVPVVLLNGQTPTSQTANVPGLAGILINLEHADNFFALAHEQAHVLQSIVGHPLARSDDWLARSLQEGYADAFAMLVAQLAGAPTAIEGSRLGLRMTAGGLSPSNSLHQNGVLVVNVIQNLQALLQQQALSGAPGATDPSQHLHVLLHLMIEVAAHSDATMDLDQLASALSAAAPTAGIPLPLIHQAMAQQGWVATGVDQDGGCASPAVPLSTCGP